MQHDVEFLSKLSLIRVRFVERLAASLPQFEELHEVFIALDRRPRLIDGSESVAEEPLPIDLIAPLRVQTHRIAGSAQTFGFADLSVLARELERYFDATQPPLPVVPLQACLERFLAAARRAIAETPAQMMPVAVALAPPAEAVPAPPHAAIAQHTGSVAQTRDAARTAPAPRPVETLSPPGDRALHVMVVDDDELVRELLRSGLSAMGWRMTEAASGLEAILTLFACSGAPPEARPDVILMDVNMPGMDGFSALDRIKNSPLWREIPIILLTRRDEETSQIRGFMVGADDYLTKPFDLGTVVRRIPDVLDARARRVLLGASEPERGIRLAQILRENGLRVKIVYSSSDAWSAISEEPPAVALLDADLRGEGGIGLLARARAQPATQRVQILIGLAEDSAESRIAAIEAGATDCLPFMSPSDYVAARIRTLLHAAKPG